MTPKPNTPIDLSLEQEARRLPARPGVYMFAGDDGEILYVGKAKSLRARVRSYFGAEAARSFKTREIGSRARSLETFVVHSEAEALLLESNLIKEYRPRFNVQLRDDKSYPYVKVTVNEPFPRILVTRRLESDGARYFGPFTDVGAMRRALRTVKRMYTVRSCAWALPDQAPDRPCLDYHIGRCDAPCVGFQSQEEYRAMIDEIIEILSGRTAGVKKAVRARMEQAAAEMNFERAAHLRDVIRGLESIERRQAAIDFRGGDRDVLGIAAEGDAACGIILRVREGRLLGREVHYLGNVEGEETGALVEALLAAHYLRREDLPRELLVPVGFTDLDLLEEMLAERRGGAFHIHVPARGRKRRLVELASENAAHALKEHRLQRQGRRAKAAGPRSPGSPRPPAADGSTADGSAAEDLARGLGLEHPPRDLLCFDVSTLAGRESVGSAVWLADGNPNKGEYRRFRIRSRADGVTDDYAMMQEIAGRYFERRVREQKRLPDLVVIDGGRGQLAAARQAMERAGVSDVPVVALAKREEEVFVPGRPDPVRFQRRQPGLHWLQRARDEAHRFALGYNRTLRRRRTLRSRLDEIPGIGPARERELLRRFGSVQALGEAPAEEIARTPGIGMSTAERIRRALAPAVGPAPAGPEPAPAANDPEGTG